MISLVQDSISEEVSFDIRTIQANGSSPATPRKGCSRGYRILGLSVPREP